MWRSIKMQELLTFPADELKDNSNLWVSFMMEIEKSPFHSDKDLIQFQNLVKEAKEIVIEKSGEDTWQKMYEQIKLLDKGPEFWRQRSGGIVIYLSSDSCYFYTLGIEVENAVQVSEKPQILPVLEDFQFLNHYQVLCLNSDSFRLFNGRGYRLEEVQLPEDAPDTLTKALGDELTGGELNVTGRGGTSHGEAIGMFHGHNEKSREEEIDQTNYFRQVDDYVYEHYSKDSELPLALFALPENQAVFRGLSNNHYLSEERVEKSSSQLTNQQIEEASKKVAQEVVEKRHKKLIDDFNETIPSLRLESQYSDLAMASIEGRIEYLIIEDELNVKGSIDENGQFQEGPENDYLNDLAWNVFNTNGKVYILNREDMPSSESLMAGLRY